MTPPHFHPWRRADFDAPRWRLAADVILLECIDCTLIADGILHYCSHLRNGFAQPNCRMIPAAGVMKAMLVEMRTGDLHGVDMTMADAYRWSKEVRPCDLRKEKYVQMTEVFDMFVFDFAEVRASLWRRPASGVPTHLQRIHR